MTFRKEPIQQRMPEPLGEGDRVFEREEKEKRAAELVLANKELAYQNEQKEQRAQELVIANKELAYQNEQKEKRAAELVVANKELAFQNDQKEQRAQELIFANKELAFQNEQKEKRAAELAVANIELAYQNDQKEQRAQELAIANIELAYQNEQKEKRAAELVNAIKDLEAFAYVSSHHLQEPLRKIHSFVDRLQEREAHNLTDKGRYDLGRIDVATARMSQLIQDIYTYSRINVTESAFEWVDVKGMIEEIKGSIQTIIEEKHATINTDLEVAAHVIPSQFRMVLHQLIENALKFSNPASTPQITISGKIALGKDLDYPTLYTGIRYCHIEIKDNGIGFQPKYGNRIFEIFQKLHTVDEYAGTGIGLAIVKKIMDHHKGYITATGEEGKGAIFSLYIPADEVASVI